MVESENLSTKYNPVEVEAGRYQKWLAAGVFKPSANQKAQPYSIVIPPPNVTGKLHLGHAWDTTLQDIIIRQKRMKGYDTLWLPGMDHAGIATQAKVEEKLAAQGVFRYDLGREKFVKQVWAWKEEYAETIREQWAKLGLSLDYDRERFTLDEGLSAAVRKVFVELYKKGLIYRANYLVNWDPAAKTALSDIEVIHKEVQGAEHYFKYLYADGSGNYLTIMTTRPETIFGDGAIAVHPSDERYKYLIGKEVIVPLTGYKIPIIADEYPDPAKGSGAVKITPAHDPNDYEVGLRHNIKQDIIMDFEGKMAKSSRVPKKYQGLDRFEARKQFIKDAEVAGLLIKIEPVTHSVGHSERSGVMVEPMLSTQWFVKMDELAKKAIANQNTEDSVHFYPERFENTFIQWMENVHDWVISRQLWWGHQIPAWYHNETGEVFVGERAPVDFENWTQDTDVLDTWFSSALWPFSTMGWPDVEAEDFQRYFPTNTLVTGYDIIFFWVSRMIFQSLEFTKRRPFENVLIHGLIRAEDGRKMSKSLGNGIDPMEVIDKYGADALRWFLSNGSAPGQDMRFSYEKMDAAWNFINKIWNISRYILMNNKGLTEEMVAKNLTKVAGRSAGNATDRWILTRLNETIEKVEDDFERFEFGEAGRVLYNFIWDEFADWYLELTKEVLYGENEAEKKITRSVLTYVLDQVLRLLHPMMPFVTEEIFEQLPHAEKTLVTAAYPKVNAAFSDEKAVAGVEILKELIRAVRTIRLEVNTPLSKKVPILVKTMDVQVEKFLQEHQNYIKRFTNPEILTISKDVEASEMAKSAVLTGAKLYLPLKGLIDLDEEIARLQKDLVKLTQKIQRLQTKLANERFVSQAPEKVVEAERAKEKEFLKKQAAVKERITMLQVLD
ncbi:MAG: valine--tRNA ligase [Lactobacillales bacterium]|nr:valine--tRNA ligase [Lactobacillales bacterium]